MIHDKNELFYTSSYLSVLVIFLQLFKKRISYFLNRKMKVHFFEMSKVTYHKTFLSLKYSRSYKILFNLFIKPLASLMNPSQSYIVIRIQNHKPQK